MDRACPAWRSQALSGHLSSVTYPLRVRCVLLQPILEALERLVESSTHFPQHCTRLVLERNFG